MYYLYCIYIYMSICINCNFQSLHLSDLFLICGVVYFFGTVLYILYSYLSDTLTAKAHLDYFNYHRINLAITELFGI